MDCCTNYEWVTFAESGKAKIILESKGMLMEAWILLSAAVLLGGLLWTAGVMKRSGAFGNKDTANSEQVRQHPYRLNPVIWLFIALFIVFLGIIAIVWVQER